jgi:hypothetical protein
MSSDRLTRADAIRIYEKVMHDVLGIPDASHPLRVALDRNGVTSLITLLSLSSTDIENLSYLPEQVDGDPIPRLTNVNAGHRGLIRQFQAWIVFLGVALFVSLPCPLFAQQTLFTILSSCSPLRLDTLTSEELNTKIFWHVVLGLGNPVVGFGANCAEGQAGFCGTVGSRRGG